VRLYDEQVLPRMINVLLGNREFARVRHDICAQLTGDVLEIGFGSGLNVPHLPAAVTGLWGVDPSVVARKLAARRIAASTVPIHDGGRDAQHLDFPDVRFDAALSTGTLCTIPDAKHALGEVRRVLKPNAFFYFAEHGHARDPRIARRQARWRRLQQRVAGGCQFDLEIEALIEGAGFEILDLHNLYLRGQPKAWSYMYVGVALNPIGS
jgi:ubiquinone/menaquinone biosynthesis C-methylase UbiE